MSETWVNAVIELTVPLDDVAVESSRPDKSDAAARLFEELLAVLPDRFAGMVGVVSWEDVSDDEGEVSDGIDGAVETSAGGGA